jgi:hypothetical protein
MDRCVKILVVAVALAAASGTGCMTKAQAVAMRTGQGEAMPVIEIEPGVAERLALMDEYRLHDETRKLMMRRPHVTIEELPPDDPMPQEASEPEEPRQP